MEGWRSSRWAMAMAGENPSFPLGLFDFVGFLFPSFFLAWSAGEEGEPDKASDTARARFASSSHLSSTFFSLLFSYFWIALML